MQKILILSSYSASLRSGIDGYGAEDGDLINQNKEIGLSNSMRVPHYATVMHAIADGWKLLAPPTKTDVYFAPKFDYIHEWYLVKD